MVENKQNYCCYYHKLNFMQLSLDSNPIKVDHLKIKVNIQQNVLTLKI